MLFKGRYVKIKSLLLFGFLWFIQMIADVPRLLIKIPTRQRPAQFFKVLDLYYRQLSYDIPFLFLVTCDQDDVTMNNQDVIARLKNYPKLFFYFGINKSKVEAYNHDMDKHFNDFDLVLVTSDDTIPCKNFDRILSDLMVQHFPDFDGVINFNDGHVKSDLNTFPVIGRKYYERFGFIYNPVYRAFACDNEFTEVSKMLKKEFYTDQVIIEHTHPYWTHQPYDALYVQNDQHRLNDNALFKERRRRNFDLA